MRRTVCLVSPVHEILRILKSSELEYRLSAGSCCARDVSDVGRAPIGAPTVTLVCNKITFRDTRHKVVKKKKRSLRKTEVVDFF